MYDNLYGQLYNNIKSEILASLSEKQSINKIKSKNIKEKQTDEEDDE